MLNNPAAAMTSVEVLRSFIEERLAAAAGEIFSVFQRTVVRYEEELDRQRKLLETRCTPQIKFHRTESPQRAAAQQQTSLEEHGAPQVKEEEEEEEDLVQVTVADGGSEDSHDSVRDRTAQRPTAGAVEMFTVFDQTVVQDEEEIHRRRRLLGTGWKHHVESPRSELLRDERLLPPEGNAGPDPSGGREPCSSREVERLALKLEADSFAVTPADEDGFLRPYDADDPKEFSPLRFSRTGPRPITAQGEGPGAGRAGARLGPNPEAAGVAAASAEERTRFGDPANSPPETKSISRRGDSPDSGAPPPPRQPDVSPLIHTRSRASEAPFLCAACGKRFLNLSSLKRHALNHAGQSPFACATCGKSFTRHSYLLVHARIHTGEKPHRCLTCGKRFTQQNNLLVHARTHTGERPYACHTCGKRFSLHGNLLVHGRTHTGERPYACGDCGKRFSRRDTLLVHTRTHTDEKPYHCEACGKSFSQQRYLLRHVRIHAA